jgi:hypothetical protein
VRAAISVHVQRSLDAGDGKQAADHALAAKNLASVLHSLAGVDDLQRGKRR